MRSGFCSHRKLYTVLLSLVVVGVDESQKMGVFWVRESYLPIWKLADITVRPAYVESLETL